MFQDITKPWIMVFKKANAQTIMDLGVAVNQFLKMNWPKQSKGLTPLHVVAATGKLALFQTLCNHI